MQIIANTPNEAQHKMRKYIDRGWVMISLEASSYFANELINRINTIRFFDDICSSDSIGINAINFKGSNNFILSLILDTSSLDAIKNAKLFLRELKQTKLYGKEIISTNIDYQMDEELNNLIDYFWKSKNKSISTSKNISKKYKKKNRIIKSSLIIFVCLFLISILFLNNPRFIQNVDNQSIISFAIKLTKNDKVMTYAIDKCSNIELLISISKIDSTKSKRKFNKKNILYFQKQIANKLEDKKALLEILKYSNNPDVQIIILKKITNHEVLNSIALDDDYSDIVRFLANESMKNY